MMSFLKTSNVNRPEAYFSLRQLRRHIYSTTFLLGFFLLTSCALTPRTVQKTSNSNDSLNSSLNSSSNFSKSKAYALPEKFRPDAKKLLHPRSQVIPSQVNKRVLRWVNYYQGRGRKHMLLYLSRLPRYKQWMQNILREHSLPDELIYVALIESGFSPTAHSHAQAVGYWQFIRSTARIYSLEVDAYVDERKDPLLSTVAASKYFLNLYNRFGDWYLAMASYNAGENRVARALRKAKRAGRPRDFWGIYRYLPKETRNYVPKFIAARLIAENPHFYGFPVGSYKPQDPFQWGTVLVPYPISLLNLSKKLGVPFKELHTGLNPAYSSDLVPVAKGEEVEIRVPPQLVKQAQEVLSECRATEPKLALRSFFYHKVRRGETLSHIARRYRTSIRNLRGLNKLNRRNFLRVGRKLRVPQRGVRVANYVDYEVPVQAKSSRKKRSSLQVSKPRKLYKFHVVRSGENLYTISRRYRVNFNALMRNNGLTNSSVIYPGQKIKLQESVVGKVWLSPSNIKTYRLSQGETLSDVSKKFNVKLNDILWRNGLRKKSVVHPGQKIKLPQSVNLSRVKQKKLTSKLRQPSSVKNSIFYTVRKGDSLFRIAQVYKVSVNQIKKWNKLKRDIIKPGRILTIYR